MCEVLRMGLNEKQGASNGDPNQGFYIYREPGLSDAEYERIKRNMLDYRNTMDRVLEARYVQPNSVAALQKEKAELLKKHKEMQDAKSVKTPESKHAKPPEKNRVDSGVRGKGAERGRERRSQGRS